jgi:hypothetical protein
MMLIQYFNNRILTNKVKSRLLRAGQRKLIGKNKTFLKKNLITRNPLLLHPIGSFRKRNNKKREKCKLPLL